MQTRNQTRQTNSNNKTNVSANNKANPKNNTTCNGDKCVRKANPNQNKTQNENISIEILNQMDGIRTRAQMRVQQQSSDVRKSPRFDGTPATNYRSFF